VKSKVSEIDKVILFRKFFGSCRKFSKPEIWIWKIM